jgi:hypothetical protein
MFAMDRNHRKNAAEIAQVHRLNLQKNLQRRLDAAKAKGDERLVRMLEAEASYLG